MSDPVYNTLRSQRIARITMESTNQMLVDFHDKLIRYEQFEADLEKKKNRLTELKQELSICQNHIQSLNNVQDKVRLSSRLSSVLHTQYETPEDKTKYAEVMLREGYVQGVTHFRQKMEELSKDVIDYRRFGFSTGVNALSYSLNDWFESIKKNPYDAIFFSRILSIHDAVVRQFFEPQMAIKYLIHDLPSRGELVTVLNQLKTQKSGVDFEEWRKARSMSILKSIVNVDTSKGNISVSQPDVPLSKPFDLISRIPEHSLVAGIMHLHGHDDRFSYYVDSPLGLSETLGTSECQEELNRYTMCMENIEPAVVYAFEPNKNTSTNTMG